MVEARNILAPTLTTTRLHLTLFNGHTLDDAAWVVAFLNDPIISPIMEVTHLKSPEDFLPLTKLWALNPTVSNRYTGFCLYLVRLLSDVKSGANIEQPHDGIIGFVSLRQTRGLPDLGYGLLPNYWGRGYASEAAQRLFDYVKDEKEGMGLKKFIAYAGVTNEGSRKVLKKIGFVELKDAMVDENWHSLFVLPGMDAEGVFEDPRRGEGV